MYHILNVQKLEQLKSKADAIKNLSKRIIFGTFPVRILQRLVASAILKTDWSKS